MLCVQLPADSLAQPHPAAFGKPFAFPSTPGEGEAAAGHWEQPTDPHRVSPIYSFNREEQWVISGILKRCMLV